MDTCNKVNRYLKSVGYECRVFGVPKTIDNDLFGTDHCPGFSSAAKYIATSIMEVSRDCQVYDTGMITIVECMVAVTPAGSPPPRRSPQKRATAPDLIYLPERDFSMDQFL